MLNVFFLKRSLPSGKRDPIYSTVGVFKIQPQQILHLNTRALNFPLIFSIVIQIIYSNLLLKPLRVKELLFTTPWLN